MDNKCPHGVIKEDVIFIDSDVCDPLSTFTAIYPNNREKTYLIVTNRFDYIAEMCECRINYVFVNKHVTKFKLASICDLYWPVELYQKKDFYSCINEIDNYMILETRKENIDEFAKIIKYDTIKKI